MEINESNILKKSDHDHQVEWCITENQDDLSHGSSHSKSYTCSFCKRGFSNAQALGGHMNIHRKDRARLREALADEVHLSLDITSSASSSIDHDHHHCSQDSDDKSILMIEPDEDHRRNEDDAVHPRRDRGEKIQKQPFFGDAKLESPEPSGNEKIQSRSQNLPPNETLDLELRLGPEPHDICARRSTREFF